MTAMVTSAPAKRARWGIVDQGLSSLANFGVAVVAAREAAPREFGTFSLALAIAVIVLWAVRSLVSEPFVVRLTTASGRAQGTESRKALGAATTLGAAAGALVLVVGVVTDAPSASVLLAIAVALPLLVLQDTYRYLLTASSRTRAAAANDACFVVVEATILGVLLATDHADATTIVGAFGAAAAVAAVFGAAQTTRLPSLGATRRWLADYHDIAVPFLYELIVINGSTQLTLLAIAAVGEVVAVGQLRASMLLLSPLTVLFGGIIFVALPEAVRLAERSARHVGRLVGVVGGAATLLTAAWSGGVALVPDDWGTDLLGANWAPARDLLVPTTVLTAAAAWMLAVTVGLRALEAARPTLRLRSIAAPLTVAGGVVGVLVDGATGAAFGLAAGCCSSAVLAVLALLRVLRDRSDSGTMTPSAIGRVRADQ